MRARMALAAFAAACVVVGPTLVRPVAKLLPLSVGHYPPARARSTLVPF